MAINIVLVHPEIPPNTGNIIRLSANADARLHLVHPLGFNFDAAHVRRAGLDYADLADLVHHDSWEAFDVAAGPESRRFAFTAHARRWHTDVEWRDEDYLVFGRETSGLEPEVVSEFDESHRLRIPMRPGRRSLNLSNAVAIVTYEAWRQQGFEGAV